MQEQDLDLACPICSSEGTVKMIAHVTEIPISEHTQVTVFCTSCGWKQADFIPPEEKIEKWSLSVKSQADLSSRVVRSSSCTVRIPELDLEVNPGSSSTGYVSNIEGVLNRFIEIIDMVARQTLAELTNYSPNSDLTLEELTSQVEKLNQMKMRLTGFDEQHFESFTLELLDPRGHSQILHPDATERELTEEKLSNYQLVLTLRF